jgi:hypothetical protein
MEVSDRRTRKPAFESSVTRGSFNANHTDHAPFPTLVNNPTMDFTHDNGSIFLVLVRTFLGFFGR